MAAKINLLLLSGLFITMAGLPRYSYADSATVVIPFSGAFVSTTCEFDRSTDTVTLADISINNFADATINNSRELVVSYTCGGGAKPSVQFSVEGSPDDNDNTAFKNMVGNGAANVALRVLDESGKTVPPQSNVQGVATTPGGSAIYTFKVGYVETQQNAATEGAFEAQLRLKFDYS